MPSEKTPPPQIRKACMILGLKPERLTIEAVNQAWQKQMGAPGVQPNLCQDAEAVSFLNAAKETLLKWLRDNGGFGFGGGPGGGGGPYQPNGVPNQPLPGAGNADVALPLPESDPKKET